MRDGTLAHWYQRFHGERPVPVVEVYTPPRELADVGEALAVVYRTKQGVVREHPFGPAARPTLARDESGKLHVIGGAYKVTERGIVDMGHEMARYVDPRTRFSAAGVPIHGLTTPREGVAVVRHNPVSLVMDGVREVGHQAGSVAILAGTAAVTVAVSDLAVEQVPVSQGWRSVIQVGIGALPGSVALPHYPNFGRGLIVGGFVGGLHRAVRAWGWDQAAGRWLASMLPARAPASGVEDLPFKVKVEARAQ